MLWQITVALALFALTLWIRWRQKMLRTFTELGIPGPKPNILFGNMLDLYRKGPFKCQEEWIKKYGTTFGYYFGMQPVVVIGDEESLKQVQIKEFQSFTDRPINLFRLQSGMIPRGMNHLINQTGKEWKETRSLLSPAFTSGKLKQMASTMMDAIDVTMDLVEENVSKKNEFDMYRLWQGLTADVIGRTALGIDVGVQRNQDHPLMRSVRIIFSQNSFQSLFVLISFSFKEFGNLFFFGRRIWLSLRNKMEDPIFNILSGIGEVITNRRANNINRPDLLQSLMDVVKTEKTRNVDVNQLTARDDNLDEQETTSNGPSPNEGVKKRTPFLSNDKVESNALMMYLAGYETTSTALGFTTYVLVKYPEIQERLRNEVKTLFEKEGELSCIPVQNLQYMDQVFTETLRVYPPIFMFVNRVAVKDVKIKNYLIPKGMTVQVPVYWLHHNPNYWEDPEKFDPSRFEKETDVKSKLIWQPFGAGPRNCIGMRFALMEAKLAIAKLLLKYRLEPGEKTDYKGDIRVRMALSILSPLDGVHVRATRLNK